MKWHFASKKLHTMVKGLVALLMCVCSLVIHGHDPKPTIKVYTNPLPFFSEIDQQDNPAGYSIELARMVTEKAGYRPDIEALPWARILLTADSQLQALILGLVRTPEREDDYHWITPISRNYVAIYVAKKPAFPIVSFKTLDKFGMVAVLRDDYRQQILIENDVANMVTFNTWQQALGSLVKGRVDSVFFSDLGVILTCAQAKLNCTSLQRVMLHDETVSYIAMPKQAYTDNTAMLLKAAALEIKKQPVFKEMWQTSLKKHTSIANAMELVDGVVSVNLEP